MNTEMSVVEAQVVDQPVKQEGIPSSIEVIKSQRANFQAQLEQVRQNLVSYQKAFEAEKSKGTKLEGAIESLDLLLKSLQK